MNQTRKYRKQRTNCGRRDAARKLRPLLDTLVHRVRPMTLPVWGPRSCVYTSVLVREALTALGVASQVAPVEVDVVNHTTAKGFTVPSRSPHVGTGWNGHMVVLVEDTVLVDLTIDQAHYPTAGVTPVPLWLPVPAGFAHGAARVNTRQGDLTVAYTATDQDVTTLVDDLPEQIPPDVLAAVVDVLTPHAPTSHDTAA